MINTTQMLKGILEGCVLMIVSDKPCYSQEIVASLNSYGFTELSDGTIFPLLLRLEKEGLFEIKKIPVSSGPNRKYYSLSEKGIAELNEFQNVWKDFRTIVDNIMKGRGKQHG